MSAHILDLSLIFETYSHTSCLPEAFHLCIMGIIVNITLSSNRTDIKDHVFSTYLLPIM